MRLTVGWNLIKGIIAIASGLFAGSVALVGFGVDSFIETSSGIVAGWRKTEPVDIIEML